MAESWRMVICEKGYYLLRRKELEQKLIARNDKDCHLISRCISTALSCYDLTTPERRATNDIECNRIILQCVQKNTMRMKGK